MTTRLLLLVLLLLAPFASSPPPPLNACAAAPPRDVVVEIASESAIIIWDAKTQTQHFIRRATFTTSASGDVQVKDFGFLVPTPKQPRIAAAEDKAFDALAQITAPKTETRPRPAGGGCGIGCAAAPKPGSTDEAPAGRVNVLEEGRVGNHEYKSLQADDAQALTDWLNERNYEIRPALTRWLEQYVKKGWVITAFKIVKGAKSEGVATSAVRMSFQTDKPFFPYREPDDMHDVKGKRLLRVFFIGDSRVNGMAGAMFWPGKTAFARKLDPAEWEGVTPHLELPDDLKANGWLTEFEDPSSPRPGNNDVTFTWIQDQNPVERPTKVIYTSSNSGALPTYLGFAALVMCLYLTRGLRLLLARA